MTGRYSVWLSRDVVEATGPESDVFLQGQLSQDIAGIGEGESCWSWLLSPQGKVDALLRVTRLRTDAWLLDTDGGYGDAVTARLDRFKLRTKVSLSSLDWRVLGLRGSTEVPELRAGEDLLAIDAGWPGLPGTDILGASPSPPEGWPLAQANRYEADRILAGVPKMGAELTERTIPAETGLISRTVSFTKGCYTGQELVARIDSRGGHVPRHLRLLRSSGSLAPGAELTSGGKSVGEVTSAAADPEGGWVALGYVHRSVLPPAEVRAGPDDGPVRVLELSG